ncbi:hypothetical protein BIY29_00910 [Brenneria alni]|uniref:TonB-dependent receptor n=1 Tax=Brenneria alni TaxID=71656 RepID=A0A421DU28_9GAMM|nr:TonB-dependent siderophore receptor [Brenneria alni]RLM28248.1 hypothetical protein BIY29_00910 [Brenneria alni]
MRISSIGLALWTSTTIYAACAVHTVQAQQPSAAINASQGNPANADSAKKSGSDTITVVGKAETATMPVDGYIVTRSAAGTKTDTPLIETPQAISVVTADQMEAQGVQQLWQAFRYSAGIQGDVRGDISRADAIYIRGIGSLNNANQFLDGLRLPRGTSYLAYQINPHSLERVEVLKGPASALYGQAPLSGIVNATSKRPTATRFAEVEALFGSHNRQQYAFDVGGPISDDGTLLYRLHGLALDSDTSVKYTKEKRFSIAPSLTWAPNESTSLTFLASYERLPDGGFFGNLPARGTIKPNTYGAIPSDFYDGSPLFDEYDRTQATLGYNLEHWLSDSWKINQNFRYLYMKMNESYVHTWSLLPDDRTLFRNALWSDQKLNAANLDTNLQGQLNTGIISHDVMVGFDYQWDKWQQDMGLSLLPPATAAPSLDLVNPDYSLSIVRPDASTLAERTQNILGLYAQDHLKIDKLGILLSGRYDWADINNRNKITAVDTKQDLGKFTWRSAVIYNFDSGFAPYISYATSFDPTTTANAYGPPFKPTTGKQWEAGLKYQPTNFPGMATLSVFDLTQQNVLARDTSPGAPPTRQVQVGEIQSKGIELEAQLNPITGLNLISALTWIDPKVEKGDNAGMRPTSVSRVLASFWADYTVQTDKLSGLRLGAGVRYAGSSYADTANTLEVPSYTTVDAAIHYDLGAISHSLRGLSASLNLTNLFDKTYYTCNAPDYCNYGEGRTVYGSLKYRW